MRFVGHELNRRTGPRREDEFLSPLLTGTDTEWRVVRTCQQVVASGGLTRFGNPILLPSPLRTVLSFFRFYWIT